MVCSVERSVVCTPVVCIVVYVVWCVVWNEVECGV